MRAFQQPFFVTGLPRSRTAWIANWLTTDWTLCYHDHPFRVELTRSDRRVGFSGSELVYQYDNIVHLHKVDAPWLVVLRNQEAALQSFRVIADKFCPEIVPGLRLNFEKRQEALVSLCTKANTRTIEYDKLDDEIHARAAWHHLLPEIEFDGTRWNLLREMNVQQIVEKGIKRWEQERQ